MSILRLLIRPGTTARLQAAMIHFQTRKIPKNRILQLKFDDFQTRNQGTYSFLTPKIVFSSKILKTSALGAASVVPSWSDELNAGECNFSRSFPNLEQFRILLKFIAQLSSQTCAGMFRKHTTHFTIFFNDFSSCKHYVSFKNMHLSCCKKGNTNAGRMF